MRRFLKHIVSACTGIAIASSAAMGQTITSKPATFDDYMPLLQDKGYDAYVFDISGLSDHKVQFAFTIREYEGDKLVKDNVLSYSPAFYNMRLLTDIPEEYRQSWIDDGIEDPERGILELAKKITIGLMPADADSLKRFSVSVENMGTFLNQLELKPLTVKETGKVFYTYNPRPFKLDKAPAEGYVPLVLLGSMWFDEQFNVFRFCGENEIDPDLSVEESMVHFIPHYYVFGVDIHPVD